MPPLPPSRRPREEGRNTKLRPFAKPFPRAPMRVPASLRPVPCDAHKTFYKTFPKNAVFRQKGFPLVLSFSSKRKEHRPPLRAVLLNLTRGQPHPPSSTVPLPLPGEGLRSSSSFSLSPSERNRSIRKTAFVDLHFRAPYGRVGFVKADPP